MLDTYPFGFNGQMKMNEIAGTGNWNTAEFWEYNTRTARRENKDPVKHTWESPYSAFGDNPIARSDINGDDYYKGKDGTTHYEAGKLSKQEMKDMNYIKYLGKEFKGKDRQGHNVRGDENGKIETELKGVEIVTQRPQAVKNAIAEAKQNDKEIAAWRDVHNGGYGPMKWEQPFTFSLTYSGGQFYVPAITLNLTAAPGEIGLSATPDFGLGGSKGPNGFSLVPSLSCSITTYVPNEAGTNLTYANTLGWGDQWSGSYDIVNAGYGRGLKNPYISITDALTVKDENILYRTYSLGVNTPTISATYHYTYTFNLISFSDKSGTTIGDKKLGGSK